MLAVLFILGALCPLTFAEIPIRLLSPINDGVLAGRFPNAFLLLLPDCNVFGNQPANLLFKDLERNENNTANFTVPSCFVNQTGYFLQGLKSGTSYNMSYTVGANSSSILTEKTTTALDYQQIDTGLPGRSRSMLAITVILSLAMVMLVAGLIVSFFFSG